jgi:2-hydroxy-3-oxopropionate reductase
MKNPKIAFLGTGKMGFPMARHLASAGLDVSVWNRTRSKAEHLANYGARVRATIGEATDNADIIIVMLSTSEAVTQVLLNKDQTAVNQNLSLGMHATVIVMSSISLEASKLHSKILSKANIDYIDAPVSGGEVGAQEATLTIMAGGDRIAIDNVRSTLEIMGRLTHVGPVGCGQLVKLANQVIVGITIGAVSEALLLIEAGGGDLNKSLTALTGGFADSAVLQHHGRKMIKRSFEPGAYAKHQLKDMTMADALAAKLNLGLPLTQLARTLYARLCDDGKELLDHSALYLELERQRS